MNHRDDTMRTKVCHICGGTGCIGGGRVFARTNCPACNLDGKMKGELSPGSSQTAGDRKGPPQRPDGSRTSTARPEPVNPADGVGSALKSYFERLDQGFPSVKPVPVPIPIGLDPVNPDEQAPKELEANEVLDPDDTGAVVDLTEAQGMDRADKVADMERSDPVGRGLGPGKNRKPPG